VHFWQAAAECVSPGSAARRFTPGQNLSRAQVTRLIASYIDSGRVDKSHANLSGPATKRILEREYSDYGQSAYERLAGISVAQLYRFRNAEFYRKKNTTYQPTRPTPIDTVHQGDRDGVKGIYHINAVDEVTQQWGIVAATPRISESWLIPLLEQLLEQFPFTIRGFHSHNGSEFINYTVARLLESY